MSDRNLILLVVGGFVLWTLYQQQKSSEGAAPTGTVQAPRTHDSVASDVKDMVAAFGDLWGKVTAPFVSKPDGSAT